MTGVLRCRLNMVPARNDRDRLIAYRTWRAAFKLDSQAGDVLVTRISSGYSDRELRSDRDLYGDKGVHRSFVQQWHSFRAACL